jgi:hypothetical protein
MKSLTSEHLTLPLSTQNTVTAAKTTGKQSLLSPSNETPDVNFEAGQPRLDLFPSEGKDLQLNSKPVQNVAPSSKMATATSSNKANTGVKLSWNTNHHQNNNNNGPLKTLPMGSSAMSINKTTNKVPPTNTTTNPNKKVPIAPTTKASAIIYPEPKKKPSPPASISSDERVELIPESRDHPAGLDIDDFLPKHLQDTARLGYHPQPEISESEAMSSIMKGHKSLVTTLSHRKKNVQIVLALWYQKDAVKGLEQAIHFDDQSIIVDILNVINLKP